MSGVIFMKKILFSIFIILLALPLFAEPTIRIISSGFQVENDMKRFEGLMVFEQTRQLDSREKKTDDSVGQIFRNIYIGCENIDIADIVSYSRNTVSFRFPRQTPIYALFDAVLVDSGYDTEKGMYLVIENDDLRITYYHLGKVSPALLSSVRSGELLGYSGSTGAVREPQLAMEFFWKKSLDFTTKIYLINLNGFQE